MDHSRGTLEIERTLPGPVLVALLGEHDMDTCPKLRETLQGFASQGHALVIDLTETTFIDSSILHALVDARAACSRHEQPCVLQFGTSHVVHRVMTVSGLLNLFDHAESRADAVRLALELR